jgi:hypothetical protein
MSFFKALEEPLTGGGQLLSFSSEGRRELHRNEAFIRVEFALMSAPNALSCAGPLKATSCDVAAEIVGAATAMPTAKMPEAMRLLSKRDTSSDRAVVSGPSSWHVRRDLSPGRQTNHGWRR